MLGVRAIGQSLPVELPMGEVAAARCQRGEAPERAGKAFKVGRRTVEMRPCPIEPDARAEFKRRAFLAILDEEEGRLTADPGMLERIRGEVMRVGLSPASG